MSVAEFVLYLNGKITRAHDQTADPLVSELPNQQLQKRLVSYRCEWLGDGWQYRTQAGSLAADEQNSWNIDRPARSTFGDRSVLAQRL